jgi:hypothetical protein
LRSNPQDLPFALLYAAEPGGDTATLVGSSGIEPDHPAAPRTIKLGGDSLWPVGDVMAIQAPQLVRDLTQRFGIEMPRGPWHLAPQQAVILPVSAGGEATQAVVLIAGLNPCRLFDDAYRSFLNLSAAQIGSAIGYACAY